MTNITHTVEASEAAVIRPLAKGIGFLDREMDAGQIRNLAWMQKFAEAYGAKLAPHGKTTMSPKLFARQLQAGAWGMTLATAHQVRVAYEHGIRRVLMANQLVGRENMQTISRLLEDREFEFFCLVDSPELVEVLGQFFRSRGPRLNVLLEVGVQGGRTGVRNREQLQAVLTALNSWKENVVLCGVELFEGLVSDEKVIREFLQNAVDVTQQLSRENRFQRTPIILSGAGSAWFDVVAEIFSKAKFQTEIEILLRSGCYLTHDAGVYRDAQLRMMKENPVAQRMAPGLVPSLHLWAYVQSVPEKNIAILGFGKRDAAFDLGLPIPALHFRQGQPAPMPAPQEWKVTRMWDQHASMQIPDVADVRVGDLLGFDISHPCLTFDKWRYLPVVDAKFNVVDIVETYF